mmetsp:Transcript_3554/g.13115  ORF Transcript_3554/g.13115 Transcript_3554/m.13115 type:complete len:256 (+) Transcript_3554:424-1191(+)
MAEVASVAEAASIFVAAACFTGPAAAAAAANTDTAAEPFPKEVVPVSFLFSYSSRSVSLPPHPGGTIRRIRSAFSGIQKITPFCPKKPPCHLSPVSARSPMREQSKVTGSIFKTLRASPGTAYKHPSGASTAPCHLFFMSGPNRPLPIVVTVSSVVSIRKTQSVSLGIPNTFPFKSQVPPPHLYLPGNAGPIISVVPFAQSIFSTRGAWLGKAYMHPFGASTPPCHFHPPSTDEKSPNISHRFVSGVIFKTPFAL